MRIASEALGPLPFALSDASFKAVDALYPDGSIRFVRGPHWDLMHTSDKGAFWSDPFTISTRSDRMGYRLEGPVLRSIRESEMLSAAVLTGTVQVPPGGEPIVLMADRQTTGGYPMVAQVIGADVPVLAQRKPGDEILFEEIDLGSTTNELLGRERMIRALEGG
jgi:antagonist of KipI